MLPAAEGDRGEFILIPIDIHPPCGARISSSFVSPF
jgi:hypothetical protein